MDTCMHIDRYITNTILVMKNENKEWTNQGVSRTQTLFLVWPCEGTLGIHEHGTLPSLPEMLDEVKIHPFSCITLLLKAIGVSIAVCVASLDALDHSSNSLYHGDRNKTHFPFYLISQYPFCFNCGLVLLLLINCSSNFATSIHVPFAKYYTATSIYIYAECTINQNPKHQKEFQSVLSPGIEPGSPPWHRGALPLYDESIDVFAWWRRLLFTFTLKQKQKWIGWSSKTKVSTSSSIFSRRESNPGRTRDRGEFYH